MGLTPLITWAVTDPIMRAVTTKTQGSSAVEMRVWALRLAIEMLLDADFELCWDAGFELCWDAGFELCWDAGFEPCVSALQWHWDAGFEPCVSALQWRWDAGFEPHVLTLCQWSLSSLRLKYGLYYLMIGLQWFLDSYRISSKVFKTPQLTGIGFETLWTFLLEASSQDWTSNLLRYLELDLVWVLVFMSVLLNSLKLS